MPKVGTAAADPLKPFVRLRLLSLLLLLAPAWDGAALAQPMRAAVLADAVREAGLLPQPPPPTPEPFTHGSASPQRTDDRLGVWLTTVDSAVLRDRQEASRAIDALAANGFTRVALPLYTGGALTWPVASARNRFGVPLDGQLPGEDHVPWLLRQLGKRGLVRVGWLEFGLMAPVDAPWLQNRPDLLLRDRRGSALWAESPGLNRVWLNPSQPEVQAFLEDLVLEACTSLPLEAIQFDDHLGYPSRFGYDDTSLRLWRATPEGAVDPLPAADAPAWLRWRADQVTALLARLRVAMQRRCPAVKLSVAPNPREFSYRSSLADWPTWVQRGLVDEVVVQIYRWDPKALAGELADSGLAMARERLPLRIGLLAGLRRQPKSAEQLRQELALVRQQGFKGIDLFFYESVRPLLPLEP